MLETDLFFDGKEAHDVWMIEFAHKLKFVMFNTNFVRRFRRDEDLGSTRIAASLQTHTHSHHFQKKSL